MRANDQPRHRPKRETCTIEGLKCNTVATLGIVKDFMAQLTERLDVTGAMDSFTYEDCYNREIWWGCSSQITWGESSWLQIHYWSESGITLLEIWADEGLPLDEARVLLTKVFDPKKVNFRVDIID